jgi:hypothetical protein
VLPHMALTENGGVDAGATSTAGGGQGRDGLVGQLDDLLLAKRDEEKESGTDSGGRSWADLHDHDSRSARRTPLGVSSKFLSDRGNTAFLACT